MALAQEQANAIYKHILDAVILGLESKEIEAYEASEIAEYVLDKVEKLQSETEVNKLYEDLSDLWPFLDVLMQEQRTENQEKFEGEATEGALALLQHGKVDDALALAKSATNTN